MKGIILSIALVVVCGAAIAQEPLIIDHNCIDLEAIPIYWIEQVQANARMHYAHTSHGGQLTGGLGLIEDETQAMHMTTVTALCRQLLGLSAYTTVR